MTLRKNRAFWTPLPLVTLSCTPYKITSRLWQPPMIVYEIGIFLLCAICQFLHFVISKKHTYLLTYTSCLCGVEATTETKFLQAERSCASCWTASSRTSMSRRSSSTTSRQRVLGRPRGRLHPSSPGANRRATRVGCSSGMRRTWPNQRRRRWARTR